MLRARGLLTLLQPDQDKEHKEHEDLLLFLLVQIFAPRPHNICRIKGYILLSGGMLPLKNDIFI